MIKINKAEIGRYFFMLIGCACYALSIIVFLLPNKIIGGGITGLSSAMNLLTGFYITIFIVGFNLPILLFGLKIKGWKFTINCFITSTVIGVFSDILAFLPPITNNAILAAIYGGILQGIGIGIFVKTEMSSGGTELLGRITYNKLPYGNIPTHIAIADALIVIFGSVVTHNIENILYAIILIFVSMKVSDLILTGLDNAKLCYIITDKPKEISDALLTSSPRGITLLNGIGMYTKAEHGVLITCIKRYQLKPLKQIIKQIDSSSFVIVGEAKEVFGKGWKQI